MKYRMLGRTGLRVSEIGLGCEGFSEENCGMTMKLFDTAEKLGVNYFDLYTSSPSVREAVGAALMGRRDKFIIQAHICSFWKDGQYVRTRKLDEVKEGFEVLLEQLGTDFVDVGMIHYCDSLTDLEEIMTGGVLDYARELKAQGRIRHIGMSSHNPVMALKAIETGDIEVMMFSVNPCYDLQPPSENVEDLWADDTYSRHYMNMDPDRQKLYESCAARGVGITVMKCFGGGDLLSAEMSPAGVALTPNQCLAYALSRPAVCVVLAGAHSPMELCESAAFCDADESEKDFAAAFALFPRVSWEGHCMYCGHCAPCTVKIDVAAVTKFLNLAQAQGAVPETVREHYKVLDAHAGDCIHCGACESRCPFKVKIRANMDKAAAVFGY